MPADGRLILAIESSNPSSQALPGEGSGIALGRRRPGGNLEVVGEELLRPADSRDDDLMPAIDRLARRTGFVPTRLGGVAVSVGPGGFTALRVAIATAQMIAEAAGAGLIPVPTAEGAAALVPSGEAFGVALATKGEAAFLTFFDLGGQPTAPGRMTDLYGLREACKSSEPRFILADQYFPQSLRSLVASAGVGLRPLRLSAIGCLRAAEGREPLDPAKIAPLYGREPEAVTLWRARRG